MAPRPIQKRLLEICKSISSSLKLWLVCDDCLVVFSASAIVRLKVTAFCLCARTCSSLRKVHSCHCYHAINLLRIRSHRLDALVSTDRLRHLRRADNYCTERPLRVHRSSAGHGNVHADWVRVVTSYVRDRRAHRLAGRERHFHGHAVGGNDDISCEFLLCVRRH